MIVDAGIGSPADALQAMELGCDAVLVNTAIAAAKEPIGMATAFRLAVEAGRLSFLGAGFQGDVMPPQAVQVRTLNIEDSKRRGCQSRDQPLEGGRRNP